MEGLGKVGFFLGEVCGGGLWWGFVRERGYGGMLDTGVVEM